MKASLYSQRIGIAENGAAIYLITRYDNTFPTDTNAYSARRAIWEFANKQAPDTFKGRMTFNAGAQFGPSYASGITGVGGFINEKGAGELESLFIRRFLEVPELRYNRVGISVGDDWSAPGAGVIESVDKEQKLVTLKLEEGEIGAVAVGDICMGIFHDFDPSNNATADSDDGRATALSQASPRSISVSRKSWATVTSSSATSCAPCRPPLPSRSIRWNR